MKYYNFKEIWFKLDDAKTFFEQVTNTHIDKVIIKSTHLGNVQKLHDAAGSNPDWVEITEQQYLDAKQLVLGAIAS